jgi:competence protein ComEC
LIANPDGYLHIYMLNVGQGDTTVIITPKGNLIIIDATRPAKLRDLLNQLGCDGNIEHLIVTHPHSDHYSACNNLADNLNIYKATLAPFWHAFGMGPPTYHKLIARLESKGTDINFLSGYSRWYPDAIMISSSTGDSIIDSDKPYLELLGPTNDLIRQLEDASSFETNHLSIMSRLTWRNFRIIIAGDAQMENWNNFDEERLLEEKCQVLQASHHGSKNGTQWERIHRLEPNVIIVSSDPESKDLLPDLCGSAIFAEYDGFDGKYACLTSDTGTIYLRVSNTNKRRIRAMGEAPHQNIDLNNYNTITETTNPTNWTTLLQKRLEQI